MNRKQWWQILDVLGRHTGRIPDQAMYLNHVLWRDVDRLNEAIERRMGIR